MADPQAQPTLVDIAENPLPAGGETDWLYLNKGKVWLRFAAWPAAVDEPQGTVIIATGRAEFIEKYFETVEDIQARGFAVAAFDWRGQGGSSRLLRNVAKGHVASFDDYVDDLEAAVAAAALRGLPRPFYLLAHSMGGTVALLAANRLAGQIERMVLTAPLIELADKRASGRWAKAAAGFAAGIGFARASVRPGRAAAPQDAPFETNAVTSDRKRFARTKEVLKAEPRLGLGAPTVRWYAAANRATRTLNETGFGDDIPIPALVVACGTDTVVSVRAIERFAKTLRGGGRVLIPGARHEILMERTGFRTLFWAAFDAFVPGTGLRLPIDIPPPRIKIAPPKGKVAAPPAAPVDEAGPAAPAGADASGTTETRPDGAATIAPPEPAETAAIAEVAGPERPTEAQPAEALAPAAPEAADVERRSRFGFFRRRKTLAPEPEQPADDAAAPETAPNEPSEAVSVDEPAGTQPNAAEAAFAAAADLVAEATRGEPQAWQQPTDKPTDTAAPAATETTRGSVTETSSRVSRLFRRREPAGASDGPAETNGPGNAAGETPSADAAPPTPGAPEAAVPADAKKADAAAEAPTPAEHAGADTPEAPAKTEAADQQPAATMTVETAARASDPAADRVVSVTNPAPDWIEAPVAEAETEGDPAPEVATAPAPNAEATGETIAQAEDASAETADPVVASSDAGPGEPVPSDASPPTARSRRKIGDAAGPKPRPVKRVRKRQG